MFPTLLYNNSFEDPKTNLSQFSWSKETLPVVLNAFFLALTIWLLLCLLHYGIKTNKWKKNSNSNLEKLNIGVVYSFVVFNAVLCVIHFILNFIFMFVGFREEDRRLCEGLSDSTAVLYGLILWTVFMFLWFRQKAFYTNKMLSFKMNAGVKLFSLSSIILITVSGICYVVLFTLPDNYSPGPVGCMYKPRDDSLQASYGIYVIISLAFSHLMLLGLYVIRKLSYVKLYPFYQTKAKFKVF